MSSPDAAARDAEPPAHRRGSIAGLFPPFTSRQWRVFWISTTAGYFDNYDSALLSLALKQIQRGLGIAEAGLGAMLSVIRMGYMAATLIAPLADIFGRRRLLLYTIVGYTLFTALSALAATERGFVAAQVLARAFSGAEATISLVILAEEVDAAVRGWAIGLQSALAISGYGLAAIVFAFITVIPYGWRGLYALALIPLVLIIPLRRLLPESHRFEAERASGLIRSNALASFIALLRAYPARLAIVFFVWLLYAMGAAAAAMFLPKYLQEMHGWAPGQVSLLYIFGGVIGILGNIVSGRVSDRAGRRRIGLTFMLAGPAFEFLLYSVGGRGVILLWIGWLFCDQASSTILNAYATELFPTSHRAAAGGLMIFARNAGAALGLLLEGWFYGLSGGHWPAIRLLLGFWLAAAVIMMLFFPETAGFELEAIAADRDPSLVR